MQESEKIPEIKQQDIKRINWFPYIKCPQIPLGTLIRLCMWIYEHVPYSDILNTIPIGDTNIYETLNSPLTYFNARNCKCNCNFLLFIRFVQGQSPQDIELVNM